MKNTRQIGDRCNVTARLLLTPENPINPSDDKRQWCFCPPREEQWFITMYDEIVTVVSVSGMRCLVESQGRHGWIDADRLAVRVAA